MSLSSATRRHYLLVSDFDQTLSFNDSGVVLSQVLGATNFQEKVDGLAKTNLVQQGAELAYLVRHDPEFRGVRRAHLEEAGRKVRLRHDIRALTEFLARGVDDVSFSFFVVSAAPKEVIQAALAGLVPAENIFGTEFDYEPESGEVRSILRTSAGYGKVRVVEELEQRFGSQPQNTIYVGDGSSDVHVMLHVNNRAGFTIAVSENRLLARIAKTTVLSDSAFSIVVPVLEQLVGWSSPRIRELFESFGLSLDGWEQARTDRVTVTSAQATAMAAPAPAPTFTSDAA